MKKLNLKIRLILSAIIISSVVFALAGFLSWNECRDKIDEFFDTYQLALAKSLSTKNWDEISNHSQKLSDKIIKSVTNAEEDDEAIGFAVFNNTGSKIFHDGQNGKQFSPFGKQGTFGKEIVDGDEWRVLRIMSTDNNYIIAVGQEIEFRDEVVEDMFEEFMAPWIAGWGLMLLGLLIVLTIEFRPLKKLAEDLKNRKDDNLSPLDEKNIHSEIRPLTSEVNHLLERVEKMLQKERCFIADAAHELRSPLTALKVQLEVAEMSLDNPQALKESLVKLEQGIERAARLVEQLLALSKIDSGFSYENDKIDWQKLLKQITEEYSPIAQQKNIKISVVSDNTFPFENGNSTWTMLMLRNLVDNAIKYSPNNAEVEIIFSENKLTIWNSGVNMSSQQLEMLGQRFYRPSGQKENGSGLGLSIVAKIAEVNGCKIDFDNIEDKLYVNIIKVS